MEGQPRFVGIDVSKAQVDVAVRPTGQRWVVSYDETGVKELVSQMVGLGLVDQHPCYEGWNTGLRGNCLHGPNMSWQWSCTKQLIITKISDY